MKEEEWSAQQKMKSCNGWGQPPPPVILVHVPQLLRKHSALLLLHVHNKSEHHHHNRHRCWSRASDKSPGPEEAKLNCFVVRSGSAHGIGANRLVFLQPTTRAYTARTSTGLSRSMEPMTSRRAHHHQVLFGFYPGGDSSSIEEQQRLHPGKA